MNALEKITQDSNLKPLYEPKSFIPEPMRKLLCADYRARIGFLISNHKQYLNTLFVRDPVKHHHENKIPPCSGCSICDEIIRLGKILWSCPYLSNAAVYINIAIHTSQKDVMGSMKRNKKNFSKVLDNVRHLREHEYEPSDIANLYQVCVNRANYLIRLSTK